MIRHFCTYFDLYYLPRGLTLYASLREHCPEFKLWILCMDEASHAALARLALPNIALIRRSDFEQDDEGLSQARQNRSLLEYYFTCTPSLPLYIFGQAPEVDAITYLDADLYFFASPESIFAEMGDGSVAITGHRFPPVLRGHEQYGRYNVGWLSFRRDANGLACLQWWRERCNEWCYDRCEAERFADQKYLDQWPQRFAKVVELQHKGANVAPWNVGNYDVRLTDGHVWIDEVPLIFFHFHGLKPLASYAYNPSLTEYQVAASPIVRRHVYAPYIKEWHETKVRTAALVAAAPRGRLLRGHENPEETKRARKLHRRFKRWWDTQRAIWRGVATRQMFIVVRGRLLL